MSEPEHEHLGAHPGPDREDIPDILRRFQERKRKHENASLARRIFVVAAGLLLVLLGILMSGPGVPGPGIVVILLGLSFLALESERAERLLERAIVWADKAAERARNATPRQKALTAVLGLLSVAGIAVWAVLGNIPLVPLL